MTIERIAISDRASWLKLRQRDMTASLVATLFGVHDFQTGFEAWALKTGRLTEDAAETPPMLRGRLLEPVAIQLIRELRPAWKVLETGSHYYRDPTIRLGATPDLIVECPERGLGVVQIKSIEASIFAQKWRDPETRVVEPPLGYAVQTLTEAHLVGAKWAVLAPLTVGHGVNLEIVEVPLHGGVVERIREETVAFWNLVDSGEEPAPDWGRDADVIDRMYARDDGGEVDLTRDNRIEDLLSERAEHKSEIKRHGEHVEAIDAEIKSKLGTAAIGHLADGRKVTWKTQNRKGYSVQPTSFRVLRCPQA